MPTALGTVFAERVQDMVVVLILVVVSAIWALLVDGFAASGRIVDVAVIVVAVASGLVLVLLLILYLMRAAGERLASWMPERFRGYYLHFQDGALNSFRGGQMPTQISLGILGWLMEVLRFYFVAQAMGPRYGNEHRNVRSTSKRHHDHDTRTGRAWFRRNSIDNRAATHRSQPHRCVHLDSVRPINLLAQHRRSRRVRIPYDDAEEVKEQYERYRSGGRL